MDTKELFSNRVDDYARYRPTYPPEALDYLYSAVGFHQSSTVADIGAGTGLFSRLLVDRGTNVIAVEPNQEMREASERLMLHVFNFRSAAGSAESTGLPNHSVDFIVCAQSFHWFDRSTSKLEFQRILKPKGKLVLVWNSRLTDGPPFMVGVEELLRKFGIDYEKVNHRNISRAELQSFFKENKMEKSSFAMQQVFGFEGLHGRLMSSSYTPQPSHPNYDPMLKELRELFNQHEHEGKVIFSYETEVFWGEV